MRVLLSFCLLIVFACGIAVQDARASGSVYKSAAPSSGLIDVVFPWQSEPEISFGQPIPAKPKNNDGAAQNAIEPHAGDQQDTGKEATDDDSHKSSALETPSGEEFNPLCLLNNIGSLDRPIHPTTNCGRSTVHVSDTPTYTLDSKYIKVEYFDDEDKPDDPNAAPVHEMLAYANYGQVDGYYLIETLHRDQNGTTSRLAQYDFGEDTEGKETLEMIKLISEGEQCQGGVTNINVDAVGYSHDIRMTPYDLLSMPYRSGISPYAVDGRDILACKTCCLGVKNYTNNILTDITLDSDYAEKIKKEENPLTDKQECFDKIITALVEKGRTKLKADEIRTLVRGIEVKCLGRDINAEDTDVPPSSDSDE